MLMAGLSLSIAVPPPGDRILVVTDLVWEGPAPKTELDEIHLLLPDPIDCNHIVSVRVDGLEYDGPRAPGDIGTVEDINLAQHPKIHRSIDITHWFDWKAGQTYRVSAEIGGWTYETAVPAYWHDHAASNTVEVKIPADWKRPLPEALRSFNEVDVHRAYRMEVVRGEAGWAPLHTLPMPLHHATRIEWTNLGAFEKELAGHDHATFVFRMEREETEPVRLRRQWRRTWYATIARVVPAP